MEIPEALSQALDFIQHNQRVAARTLLGQIIREDPSNEEAWIMSAQVSDKPEQVYYCLRRAIQINPDSARARFFLEKLQKGETSDTTEPSHEPIANPETVREKQAGSVPTGVTAGHPAEAVSTDTIASHYDADVATDRVIEQRAEALPANTFASQDDAAVLPDAPAGQPAEPGPAEAVDEGSLPTGEETPLWHFDESVDLRENVQPAADLRPDDLSANQPAISRTPGARVKTEASTNPVSSIGFGTVGSGFAGSEAEALAELPEQKSTPATQLLSQVSVERRPKRWLQRIFTLAGSASLFAPWISVQTGQAPVKSMSVVQILLESLHGSVDLELAFSAGAGLVLLLLTFFRFKSGPTQKWGERITIALTSLACLPALVLIASYYTRSSSIVALHWGIWSNWSFYSLVGLTALINARRLGRLDRRELANARAGRVFTWLFSLANILAILATVGALFLLGKVNPIAIGIPVVWLGLGALLSLFV